MGEFGTAPYVARTRSARRAAWNSARLSGVPRSDQMLEEAPMTAIDPVCGMEVEPATAEWKTEYKGQTYYFCAPGCLRSFQKDPEKYLKSGGDDHSDHHAAHHA